MASTAIAGRSAIPQLTITTALPVSTTLPKVTTTLPKVTTTLPKVTTTLPKVTTTLPKVTTTLPKVTTTLPKVTTTLPKVTTTLPKVTTTLPKVTTTLPKVTTTLPKVTTTLPKVTTTLPATTPMPVSTGLAKPTSVSQKATRNTTGAQPSSVSSAGGGTLFQASQPGSAPAQPGAASADLFTAAGGTSAGASAVTRLGAPRPFLSFKGPKSRRAAIIVFRLRHASRVRFTVLEVFPLCRVAGSFTVRGHAGLNRFRFNGRVRGERLGAGTYQIGLRTNRGRLLRVTIAIFDRAASPSAVAAARKRNVCGSTTAASTLPGFTLLPPVEGRFATAGATSSRSKSHAFLGVTTPQDVVNEIGKNPFALVAFGLAVLLLGVAALPQAAIPVGRSAHLLARERSLFLLVGGAALVVGVMILALT